MSRLFLPIYTLLVLLLLAALLPSCNIQRYIAEEEVLLNKVKITGAPSQFNEDLEKLVRPRPNKRFARLIRAGMWLHLWTSEGRDRKVKSWIRENLGEAPVFMDSFMLTSSARQMDQLLFNRGYFDAEVDFDISTRRQKARVTYSITPRQPYSIRDIDYFIQDRIIDSLVMTDTVNTLISRNRRYDSRVMREERERITEFLKNLGYYNFTREYVYFDVDTSLGNQQVMVGVGIAGLPDFQRHKTYYIDSQIVIEPDYRLFIEQSEERDTLNGHVIIGHPNIKSNVLKEFVFIQPNELYNLNSVRQTIIRLSDLRLYRFIDIAFEEIPIEGSEDTALLRPSIRLTPYRQYEGSFDLEIRTTDPNPAVQAHQQRTYGIAGSVSFRNKNLFRRAIQHEVRTRGGLEYISPESTPNFTLGIATSLQFPRIFIPWELRSRIIGNISYTSLDLSWVHENNLLFERQTTRMQYYYFINTRKWRHFIIPAELSLVQTQPKAIAIDTLNPFIRAQFEPHAIPASRYAFIYTNMDDVLRRNFWTLKATPFELSGNLLYLFRNILASPVESEINDYGIRGVEFFQYAKTEWDLRFNHFLSSNTNFVYRINTGIGIPYGNSRVLPFEKRYLIGGSGSLRGWRAGQIGPGTYLTPDERNILEFNHIGDFLVEANLEFRFNLGGIWRGALFTDAGNIFVWNEELQGQTGGEPGNLNHFVNSMAVAGGTGIRWDFSYFIFRIDFGWPLRYPGASFFSLPYEFDGQGTATNFRDYTFRDIFTQGRMNFGIGYPF